MVTLNLARKRARSRQRGSQFRGGEEERKKHRHFCLWKVNAVRVFDEPTEAETNCIP
jgi:hypothetical protein